MVRCYELHGYSFSHHLAKSSPTDSQKTESSMDYLSSLTNEQCQGLLNMLQLYLNKAKSDATRSNKAK